MWSVNQTLEEHFKLAQEYFERNKMGYRVECACHLRSYYEKRIAGESIGNSLLDSAQDNLAGMMLEQLGESLDQAHCQLGIVK